MRRSNPILEIAGKKIGNPYPTYFIADIAANHDGDLERAKDLIYKAAEAGADAAKFQHFEAKTIVSDHGFKSLGNQQSHQASWKKSVFEVYQAASVSLDWTEELKATCDKANIAFFTSPYSHELVEHIDPYVPAYKIGSGDITWHGIIEHIASKGKPYMLATGASSMLEVQQAVDVALALNPQFALLQCNTNYTGSLENFRFINLNVLKTYRAMYPEMVLGLSDHTPGHSTVLGAIALGVRIIEKHFTDDTSREGPDHAFSMNPADWKEMVVRSRELENSLGGGVKVVEENELQTAILQRRALRLRHDMHAGATLTSEDLIALRPCPTNSIPPNQLNQVIGKALRKDMTAGENLTWTDLA